MVNNNSSISDNSKYRPTKQVLKWMSETGYPLLLEGLYLYFKNIEVAKNVNRVAYLYLK